MKNLIHLLMYEALKGAATLKARSGCKNGLNGGVPILPIEDNNNDLDLDFTKGRSILAEGAELHVETPEGQLYKSPLRLLQLHT